MRAHLLNRGRERDVVLLELLAYAGLRPESEAITLRWRNVHDRSLVVQDTKRGRERTVPLLAPLAASLNRWRLRSGRPVPTALVVPTASGPWERHDWRNWRQRAFKDAASVAGLPVDVRPRDLRGSFVSLLVHEGRSILEVASILGHSPQICLRDYAQAFAETPAVRLSAEQSLRVPCIRRSAARCTPLAALAARRRLTCRPCGCTRDVPPRFREPHRLHRPCNPEHPGLQASPPSDSNR